MADGLPASTCLRTLLDRECKMPVAADLIEPMMDICQANEDMVFPCVGLLSGATAEARAELKALAEAPQGEADLDGVFTELARLYTDDKTSERTLVVSLGILWPTCVTCAVLGVWTP